MARTMLHSSSVGSQPVKVIFYIHALAGGGAERVWAILASALAYAGQDVVFAVDYTSKANLGLLDQSVRVVELGANHLVSTLALARLLRRERPDVSISALGGGNLKHVISALIAGRLDRAIISYHGYSENEPKLLSQMSFRLTPLLTRLAARTVAVSEALKCEVLGRHHAFAPRLVTILNPVAVPAATVTDDDLKARPAVVLAASRLTAAKDVPFLIRAFAQVRRQDARLVILGEGDERQRIEAEIERTGLGGRVELAGYRDWPWPWYAAARVFATTSRIEAFGLTVVEALAAGLPVVATDCGGPREILDLNGAAAALGREGVASVVCDGLGTLVVHGDEAAFARALEVALDDPGSVAPRVTRAADFSVSGQARAYLELMAAVAADADSPASGR